MDLLAADRNNLILADDWRPLARRRGAIPMDDTSTTIATLDQTDEDILTYTVSDEALEAAAGTERGDHWTPASCHYTNTPCC
jgi:hypothetical protein